MARAKNTNLKTGKDSNGNKIKQGDTCMFWNNNNEDYKPTYEFYELYHRDTSRYISLDKNDNNDLSWWDNCILLKALENK